MEKPLKVSVERGLMLFVLVLVAIIYLYITNAELRDLVRPHHCLFYQAAGMLCPACGGTRAMSHLFNGHFFLALKSNALAVFTVPLIFFTVFTAFRMVFDRCFTPAHIRIAPFWIWAYFVFVIIFWVVRNIPSFAFLRPWL